MDGKKKRNAIPFFYCMFLSHLKQSSEVVDYFGYSNHSERYLFKNANVFCQASIVCCGA